MLFRVQEQTCHKTYPNGNYPNSYACRPNEIEVAVEAIYCSTQSPHFAYQTDNKKWGIQHLSFDADYHAIHWDNRLYFQVCHNYDIGENYEIGKIAKRFGYHPINAPDDSEVDSIKEIEKEEK